MAQELSGLQSVVQALPWAAQHLCRAFGFTAVPYKGVTVLSCPEPSPPPADGCSLGCQSWNGGVGCGIWSSAEGAAPAGAFGCPQPANEGDRTNREGNVEEKSCC